MRRRGGRCWRSRRGRPPTAADASGSPIATSASSSSARSTRRCSTTSRSCAAGSVQACRHAARCPARPRLRRPQGDRHVLHAAADRRLSRAPHARPARARRAARADSRSCASSIRRWAAARFSSPPAGISRAPTKRRSSDRAAVMPGDIGEHERAAIRRTIAERCLYGVDLNPMAVQLARLSLWLATLAADRPLSFLDHRLQAGDSLLGAWLTNALASRRSAPAASPRHARPLPLFDVRAIARRRARDALPIRFSLESTPNDTLEQVRAKERAFARLEPARYRRCRAGSGSRICGAPLVRPAALRIPPAGVRRAVGRHAVRHAARCRQRVADRYLDGAPRRSPRAAVLSLGARIPGSVLRPRRPRGCRTPASTPSSATRRGT